MLSSRTSRFVRACYRQARGALNRVLVHAPRKRQLRIAPGATPLFRTVFFELRTRCNSTCTFCAAGIGTERRADTSMRWEIYAKAIDDLARARYDGMVAYHVNNEPLLTHDLDRYVAHARERLPRCWIRIYSNGRSLSAERGERLLRAGIDEMTINWYAADPAAPLPHHLLMFRDRVLQWHGTARVRPGTGPLAPGDRSIFRFNIHRRRIDEVLGSRAGSSPNATALPEHATGFCELPFTQVNITTDGRVSRCCADFYFRDVMGHVATQDVMAIWRGEPFARARRELLRGDRSRSDLCSACDFRGVSLDGASRPLRAATVALNRLDRLMVPLITRLAAGARARAGR